MSIVETRCIGLTIEQYISGTQRKQLWLSFDLEEHTKDIPFSENDEELS